MPSIEVKYFALLKEKAGLVSEEVIFEGSYAELYQNLAEKYHFELPWEVVQVAVNDEFASMHAQVVHNAKVVFIPPVAGG